MVVHICVAAGADYCTCATLPHYIHWALFGTLLRTSVPLLLLHASDAEIVLSQALMIALSVAAVSAQLSLVIVAKPRNLSPWLPWVTHVMACGVAVESNGMHGIGIGVIGLALLTSFE